MILLRSIYFFIRDEKLNLDKEYHIQLVQFGDLQTYKNAFNVHYQHGRRRTALTTGKLSEFEVDHYAASNGYNDLVGSKIKKGYRCLDMGKLDAVYSRMTQLKLDEAGVDIFMPVRRKVVSLADYIRKHQAPSRAGEFGFADSYSASRAVNTMLNETGIGSIGNLGRAVRNEHEIQQGIELVSKMSEFIKIANLNVFLGRGEHGAVAPCFEADRYMIKNNIDPKNNDSKKRRPRHSRH